MNLWDLFLSVYSKIKWPPLQLYKFYNRNVSFKKTTAAEITEKDDFLRKVWAHSKHEYKKIF